jgi:hypothetical protein
LLIAYCKNLAETLQQHASQPHLLPCFSFVATILSTKGVSLILSMRTTQSTWAMRGAAPIGIGSVGCDWGGGGHGFEVAAHCAAGEGAGDSRLQSPVADRRDLASDALTTCHRPV